MSEPIITALGRVQPNYRGTWNATDQYNKLDYVDYRGSSYICRINGVSGSNTAPTDDSVLWQLVAHKGDTGTIQNPDIHVDTLPTGSQATGSIYPDPTTPADNKKFIFNFGIPTGPIGPVGIEDVEGTAVRYQKDDPSEPLAYDDDPWVTLDLNNETSTLNMTLGIPPGKDGAGGVSSVDDVEPSGGNVRLKSIRYVPQELTDYEKTVARGNIEALKEPSEKQYGQFLQYAGNSLNPYWIASTILPVPGGGLSGEVLRKQDQSYGWTPSHEIPSGGNAGAILMKNSSLDFLCEWSNPISNSEINDIIAS